MLIGYARVSKGDEQSNKAQARALSEAGYERVFEEKASDGRWDRPQLHLMNRIAAAGASFRSLTEAIDATTPVGRMMMQMVGFFAEFERAMIR